MGQKTLYRSRTDQMLGGVCAGIADYFGIDPTVVRLVAVFLLLASNVAVVVAYVVLWVVVPEEPSGVPVEGGVSTMSDTETPGRTSVPGPDSPPPPPPPGVAPPLDAAGASARPTPTPAPAAPAHTAPARQGRGGVWFGVALIFVGAVLLAQMFVPALSLWQFWPVIVIVAGVLMVFGRGGRT